MTTLHDQIRRQLAKSKRPISVISTGPREVKIRISPALQLALAAEKDRTGKSISRQLEESYWAAHARNVTPHPGASEASETLPALEVQP